MDLEFFIKSKYNNQYIRYKDLETYYRKGARVIEGKPVTTLERANTNNLGNKKPKKDLVYKQKEYHRTGLYRELSDLTEKLAAEYGFEAVYVENILNPFLLDRLKAWGYKECQPFGAHSGNPPSCYKLIKRKQE